MENSMAYSISATDDHCYPGTTVLINKLDIRDQEKLNEAELFIVSVKSLQFEMEPFPEDLDFAYYKRLHEFLFGELYDWAGSVQSIDISKQRTRFCPAAEIPALLDIVLRIQDRKHKSALNLFCHLSEAVEVQGTFVFPGAGLRCSCQFQCASWAGFSTAAEVGHSGARRCGPAQTSCFRSDLEMGGLCLVRLSRLTQE